MQRMGSLKGRSEFLKSAITGDASKKEEKITDPVFLHKRGSRANILGASMRSRSRKSTGGNLIGNFLARMFNMQELSAKEVEANAVFKGTLEMQKKRNNTWFSVYCILDGEANLYIFESIESQRSIQICPLEHATIIDCCEVNLSNPLCVELSFDNEESKKIPGCMLRAENLKSKHDWLSVMRFQQQTLAAQQDKEDSAAGSEGGDSPKVGNGVSQDMDQPSPSAKSPAAAKGPAETSQ